MVRLCFIWSISNNIIDMSINIETIKLLNIFQSVFIIGENTVLLASPIPKFRKIGIHMLNHMGRADNKIKWIARNKVGKFLRKVWLKSNFDSNSKLNLVLIAIA